MWLGLVFLGIGLAALVDWGGDDGSDDAEADTPQGPDATLIEGTAGTDAFGDIPFGTDDAEVFDLFAGDDEAFGNGGDDRFLMGAGDDLANGGFGDDILYGEDGDDELFGAPGDDELFGGAGEDLLLGEAGDDTLLGGLGEDEMFGGGGTDLLIGGDGDDGLLGGTGADTLQGGAGDDIIDGALVLTGREAEEDIDPNTLAIDQGGDILEGGPGEDLMIFGPGDVVSGGVDEDLYTGFVTDPWSGHATITDMEAGAELLLDVTRVTDTPDGDEVAFTAQGNDTMVSYEGVDIVLLRNIAEDQISVTVMADGTGITVGLPLAD